MITVRLVEGLVGEGRLVAVEVLPAAPRKDEFVELADGRLFEVRQVTWVAGAPGATGPGHDSVRLVVQGVCPGCGRPVWDGKVQCDRCKLEDEAGEPAPSRCPLCGGTKWGGGTDDAPRPWCMTRGCEGVQPGRGGGDASEQVTEHNVEIHAALEDERRLAGDR